MDANGKMWVFGGYSGSYLNDVHYLDTQAGTPTWTTPSVSGNSPETRNRHVSVMDGNGKMWIFGGWGPGNGYLNDVHYLDTQAATPTWTTPSISGTSPTGRERFAAVMDSSGKIWIFGGTDGSRVDELYCLDTQATGAPTWIAPLESGRGPSSRYSLSAVLDSSRRMWLFGGGFGGSSYSNGVYYLVAEAESTTWKTPAVSSASPIGRSEHTAVMDASGRMWIFAGWDGSSRLNDVHYLDTKSAPAAWTTPSLSGSSPSTRDALSAVMDASQKIWIFGGDDGSSFLNDVHYLDTQAATPTWTTPSVAGTNPTARYRHTGVMDASGKMWIFAGIDSSGYLNDVHYLDTQAGTPTWTTPSVSGTSPEIRNRHVAVMDGNGKMWIFGGWGPGNLYLNDVHCLDTQAATPTWTTPSLSGTSPSGREQLTALMDWSGKMWIFGGTDGSRFNELHYLDTKAGTPTWSTPLVSGTIPFVRRAHSAVYDGNGKMWIFGGKTDSGYVNEVYCREVSTTTTTSSSTTSSSTTSSSTTSSSTSTSTSTTATSSSSTSSSTSTSSTSSSASTSTLTSVTKTVVQQVLSNLSNSNDGSTLAFLLEETRVGPTTFAAFSAAFSEAWPDSFTIPAIGGIVEISREVMQEVTSEAKIDGPVLVSITTINEELSAAFRSDEALGLRETYFELRSKLLSVNFWNEEGRRLKVTLMTPITLQLVDVEDENATCAFWDARASRWSKEGMETLPSDPTTLRCNVFHLTTFGAVTNRIARNIELSFQCSTFASLMDESAFSKLSEPKWLQHSSAILSIIFLILSLTAMSIAVWVDWRSKDKLPQHQREILLMRVNAGASEGLLLAVEHLTGEQVKLVIYGDNSSSIAIAQKEGVGKLKRLSGRLLWLQQRQSKDLDLRKLDTATNPSDIGAKTLGGKRINLLMYIMGFTDSSQQLGRTEFEAERAKAEQKRRLPPEKSAQANQLAKRLLRLTMTALLADSALGLATAEDQQCFREDEPQKQPEGLLGRKETGGEMLGQVVMGLTIAIVILSIAILILLKALKNTARELRRHVTSWQALRSAVGGASDEEQERIDLSMWNAPMRWPENQGSTEWQNWSN
eukprot:g7524.t1